MDRTISSSACGKHKSEMHGDILLAPIKGELGVGGEKESRKDIPFLRNVIAICREIEITATQI